MSTPGRQRVIVYTRDGRDLPYATAYCDDQAADMTDELHARYGRGVKARAMYSEAAMAQGITLYAP